MRKGFALLEVMIASLIAALLGTALLTTISQVSRLQETVNTITSVYGRVAIVQHQMERDLMGAFVPTQVDMLQTTTDRKTEKNKPIDKVFYGTTTGDHLAQLSFITSNPLQTYFGIKKSSIKPRVARVMYRLVPDKARKNSFVLMRQEGRNLTFDAYTEDAKGALRSFAVIDGIQTLSVQYVVIEQKKSEDKKSSPPLIYKKQKNWNSEQKKNDKKQRTEPIRLPNFVEIQMVLWDSIYKTTRSFTMVIPIMAMSGEYRQEQPKKEETAAPKKTNNNSKQAPAMQGGKK